MTAIRSFPDAPMAHRAGPAVPLRLRLRLRLRTWGAQLWRTLQRAGQRRAAFELYALAGQHACTAPMLARDLEAAAAECLKASNRLERNRP